MSVGPLPDKSGPQPTERPPAAPQNGHMSGPWVIWNPKQGSLGPHIACDQIRSAGAFAQNSPQARENPIWVFLACFGPRAATKFLQVPKTPPKTSISRISRKTSGGTTQRRQSEKVAQRKRNFHEPEKSWKRAGGAELRPKQSPT